MNSLSVDNPSIPSAEMKVLCKLIKKPKTQEKGFCILGSAQEYCHSYEDFVIINGFIGLTLLFLCTDSLSPFRQFVVLIGNCLLIILR